MEETEEETVEEKCMKHRGGIMETHGNKACWHIHAI